MRALSGPAVEPADGRPARALVILLHGVGADGQDLIGLAPMLQRYLPDAAFMSPDAPEPCDMAPMGRQWFSLMDRRPEALLEGVERAAPDVWGFLEAECTRRGLGHDRCALFGFSQGSMMALHVAPRHTPPLAAVVGCSGALVAPERLEAETIARPPILLVHGTADEVVPFGAMAQARAALEAADFPLQWSIRPGLGHGIDPDGIDQAGRFLRAALQGGGLR